MKANSSSKTIGKCAERSFTQSVVKIKVTATPNKKNVFFATCINRISAIGRKISILKKIPKYKCDRKCYNPKQKKIRLAPPIIASYSHLIKRN